MCFSPGIAVGHADLRETWVVASTVQTFAMQDMNYSWMEQSNVSATVELVRFMAVNAGRFRGPQIVEASALSTTMVAVINGPAIHTSPSHGFTVRLVD
jgi:hypothetical protein